MDGLGWHDRPRHGFLHFIPQGWTVTGEYYITKILEEKVKPLFSRRSTTEEPVKQKLFTNKSSAAFVKDGASRQKQPSSGVRKTSRILLKKMNCLQIHLMLAPLRTYGASLTKLHTEIRSLETRLQKAWQNIPLANQSELARSMQQRLKTFVQKMGGTLDIDILKKTKEKKGT